MKILKSLLCVLVFFTFSSYTFAQKIGVIDTDYILSKMPEYTEAKKRLDAQVKSWEQELQTMQKDYETKKISIENEKVLLVGEQLKQRENEIKDLDKKIKKYLAEKFSGEGEINKYRANLAKPFQDQIWNAIKTVTEKNTLGIVLDKNNNMNVIFLDKKYDYTDKVLDILLKNSDKNNKETKEKGKPDSKASEPKDSKAKSKKK